jgi:diguanylate cyclase (GGDEF)-like protein/PAS domain S-box-containing protein
MPRGQKAQPFRTSSKKHRRCNLFLRLLGCFTLVALATLFGGSASHGEFLWVANGLLLSYLLLAPRRLWPHYLTAGFVAHIVVSPWIHSNWLQDGFFALHDVLGAALAAFLLRRRAGDLPDFTNVFYLLRFAVCALLAAPLILNFAYATMYYMWLGTPLLQNFAIWFAADCLGILVTTPAFVAVFRSGLRRSYPEQKGALLIILILVSYAALLTIPKFIGPSLLFPMVVFVLLQLGLGWASFATLVSAAIGAWYTAHGIGPFAAPNGGFQPSLRLQVFTVCIMVVLYSVSVVLENLRKTERRLLEIANLHALVAENSRDAILLIDLQGNRSMISSGAQLFGGWTREDVIDSKTFSLVHPDDQQRVAWVMKDLLARRDGDMIEFRVACKGNEDMHLWAEASLRTVRDPMSHLPTGILCNIREITERKNAERQLEDAFQAVQTLSITDPLTGLANRRRFDKVLSTEWRRALREQQPLSLLLIDADHFKNYNDTFGHPSGDGCLRQIAESVRCGAARAGDLAARIGGEEFAVLLPNTTAHATHAIAARIIEDLRTRLIPHPQNPTGFVTISIGAGTVYPELGKMPSQLVDMADRALYSAKHAGRNCIYPAYDVEMHETVSSPS